MLGAPADDDPEWNAILERVRGFEARTHRVPINVEGPGLVDVCLALQVQPSPGVVDAVANQFKELRCRTCQEFLLGPGRCVNWNDGVVETCLDTQVDGVYTAIAQEYRRAPKTWAVADTETFKCTPRNTGDDGTPWEHLSFEPPVATEGTVGPEELTCDELNWLLKQQVPVIRRLLFPPGGVDGLVASLRLLKGMLPKISYGHKLQASTEWMLESLRRPRGPHPVARDLVCVESLLASPIRRGGPDEPVVSLFLKQYKNTESALKCAHNKEALVALLESRFSPMKYQRSTKPASEREMRAAQAALPDDFHTKLMTIREAEAYGGVPVPTAPKKNTFGGFAQNKADRQTRGQGAASFAARAERAAQAAAPGTIGELLDALRAKKGGLQVRIGPNSKTCALVEYPEDVDVFKFAHLWLFYKNYTPKQLGMGHPKEYTWCDVAAVHTGDVSVFVLVKGAKPRESGMGNACFKQQLKPSFHHLGRALEEFNNSSDMIVPTNDGSGWAIGVGSSYDKGAGGSKRLTSTLQFRWKGDGNDFFIGSM